MAQKLASQLGLSNHFFNHHTLAQQVKDYAADGIVKGVCHGR